MKLKAIIIGLILILSLFMFASNGFSDWSVSPSSINFGDVPVGTSKTVVLTITNTGTTDILITGVYTSITEVRYFIATPEKNNLPVGLNPGEIITIAITFTPTTKGNYSGEIIVTSDDPANPYTTIPFTGISSYASGIDVSPSAIDFGTTPVGTSKEEFVRVKNNGNSNLNVNITVTSGTPFTVSKNSFTLKPGQMETIIVTFNPTQRGVYTGALTVFSDDKNTPKVVVSLRGDTGAEFGLAFFPTIMNFGNVKINTTYDKLLTIYNVGSNIELVSLTIINVNGDAFSFPPNVEKVFYLIPGEKRRIPIRFYPTDMVNYSGIVYIDSYGGTAFISLLGAGSEIGTVGLEPQNPPPSSGGGGGGGCSVAGKVENTNFGNALLMFAPAIAILLRRFWRKLRK